SPWKGVVRFGKRGKLNPRYVGPFKVLEKVGSIVYKLELPQELSRAHNTFYVSNLKKCHADEPLAVPLYGLHFDDKLQFVEEPVEIMDHEVKRLKRSRIPLVKVRWNSRHGTHTAYLLLYVDDIVLTDSSKILLQQIITSLHQEFSLTELGLLNYFLGISVTRDSSGMFLSQRKYDAEILKRAHMTHVDTEFKLGDNDFEACSCTEAKYHGVLNVVVETCWVWNLLRELHTRLTSTKLVYCDNVSAVYLSSNSVQRQRTKHIEIEIHVPSRYQYADIFTNGLSSALFEEFCTGLSVRYPPVQTGGEC
ncbi:ribonuclease H-like domain-containing protein, partial [Tanacetum coccineum]